MLRVVIEDLVASGAAVSGLGEDLAVAYAACDGSVDAAQPGWQGRSAVALGALGERWAVAGRAQVVAMGEHAAGLRECARRFWAQDRDGADALDWPGGAGPVAE